MREASSQAVPSVLTYGEFNIAIADLPAASVYALLRRGFGHYLGNEVASRVSAAKAKEAEAGNAMSDDAVAALKASLASEAFANVQSGNIGVATRGPGKPTLSPLDAEVRRLAIASVVATLKANGLKMPKGDEPMTFPNGSALTREELISRRIAHPTFGPQIAKQAKANVAAMGKMAGGAEGASLAEDLGL